MALESKGSGFGPQLARQSADDIIAKLTAYKNGEVVGSQSSIDVTAQALTDGSQIGTIGVLVQEN